MASTDASTRAAARDRTATGGARSMTTPGSPTPTDDDGLSPRTRPRSNGRRLRSAWWTAASALIVVYALLPVVWLLSLALKPAADVADGRFVPERFTWDNFTAVFQNAQFPAALRNSIGIALIATVLSVVLATFAAYAIVRLEFRGKGLLLGAALAVSMFPPVSIIGPLFDMWRGLGLYDTWPGLVIPYLTFTLPLAIFTLSAFFREIPWDLDKAARIDGATPFQAFRRVIVPLAAPGVFTSAILVFIFAWNDFIFASSLTSTTRARTVPVAIAFFTGDSQFEQPTSAIAAASVVVTVPIVIMVLLFQRRIVSGLTAGAVKG
jgi:multiple sugar transport system permease protein